MKPIIEAFPHLSYICVLHEGEKLFLWLFVQVRTGEPELAQGAELAWCRDHHLYFSLPVVLFYAVGHLVYVWNDSSLRFTLPPAGTIPPLWTSVRRTWASTWESFLCAFYVSGIEGLLAFDEGRIWNCQKNPMSWKIPCSVLNYLKE